MPISPPSQALGVQVAMGDFGTGYSSLSYMRKFPFDKIKIDKSFVADLGCGGDAEKIIAAIIGLGASLGMTLNAFRQMMCSSLEF